MLRMNRTSPEEKTEADTTLDLTPRPSPTYEGSMHNQTPAHSPTTSSAITESEALARDIKEGLLSGFVGNGTELTGEASFKGMLRVDGHLSGKVHSDEGTLIVSTNGLIDANIEVAVAQIQGTVNGDIIATKRIELGRVAKVTGNIQTPSLVIEHGAMFEGNCRMTQQQAGAADQSAQKEKQAGSSSSST
jgi:cytoskeletal protein CcmA (bactofilin family)